MAGDQQGTLHRGSASQSGGAADDATRLRPGTDTSAAALEVRRDVGVGTAVKGRYLLERIIGAGAMGQVWCAKDLLKEQARNARPQVAVKLLNADCAAQPEAFIGLEREASKAQDLAHPNIITVHTFDHDAERGCAFIVMELLAGEPLDALIKRTRDDGGVARAEALPIIEGVLDGLAYAHKKGVIHCDLKPGNVFVTQDGTPKVLDFGIARAARPDGAAPADEDQDGFHGYTPAYASLELARENDPVASDDVYSVGVVMYELLSGRHPFGQRDAAAAQSRGLKPQPIKGLKAREWQAIERALAFERAQRWSDASTLRAAFRGRSVLPRVLGAAIAVLLSIAAVLGYRAWRADQPDVPLDQRPLAIQNAVRAHLEQGDRGWKLVQAGQSFEINDVLQGYAEAYRLQPRDPTAEAGLKRAADYVIARFQAPSDPDSAAAGLETVRQSSAYLSDYAPLTAAIRRLRAAGTKGDSP